jgi:hypothetical protein
MNPVLTQIIEHPEFGYILAQAVAFAALGCHDKHVNPLRKQGKLLEGEHFVRVPQRAGLPKLHWTVTGLQTLALALGTDRAIAFTSDLKQWLQSHSALQHQPRGAVSPTGQENDADYEPAHLEPWQPPEPCTATDYQAQQASPDRYSLAELQALRTIAQSERDGQMLALLDQAISALAARQPAPSSPPVERVVYVQPQKTTHINFLWHWNGGRHNHGNGSVEAVFIVAMIVVLLSGLWMMALVSVNRSQPVYPQTYVR